jgi:ubiquitin
MDVACNAVDAEATFLGTFNYPVALLTGFIIVRWEKEHVDSAQHVGFFLFVDVIVMLVFGALTSPNSGTGIMLFVVGGAAALREDEQEMKALVSGYAALMFCWSLILFIVWGIGGFAYSLFDSCESGSCYVDDCWWGCECGGGTTLASAPPVVAEGDPAAAAGEACAAHADCTVGTFCDDGSTCRGCEAADVCTSVAGSRTSCAALGGQCCTEAFLRNCPSNPFKCFGVSSDNLRNPESSDPFPSWMSGFGGKCPPGSSCEGSCESIEECPPHTFCAGGCEECAACPPDTTGCQEGGCSECEHVEDKCSGNFDATTNVVCPDNYSLKNSGSTIESLATDTDEARFAACCEHTVCTQPNAIDGYSISQGNTDLVAGSFDVNITCTPGLASAIYPGTPRVQPCMVSGDYQIDGCLSDTQVAVALGAMCVLVLLACACVYKKTKGRPRTAPEKTAPEQGEAPTFEIDNPVTTGQTFSVDIKTLTGQSFTVEVDSLELIANVKQKLYEQSGIPPDEVRLVANSAELLDGHTVAACAIVPGMTLHLVLKLKQEGRPDQRTFADSNYKIAYMRAPKGETQTEGALFEIVAELISEYCLSVGTPVARASDLTVMLRRESQAAQPADLAPGQSMKHAAMLLWTSATTGTVGKSLFGILQLAIREDSDPMVTHAAKLARCINELCVDPRPPPGDDAMRTSSRVARKQVYRGTGFSSECKSFFVVGVTYRAPMYLATSLSRSVAERFMRDGSADEHCLWIILMDRDVDMYNASLVQKTHFAGEQEYLFPPYSVFTVVAVNWRAGTTAAPHEITLRASPDNRRESETLPTAPWA